MYKIRTTKKGHNTNLRRILRELKLKQAEFAELAELQPYLISQLCTGKRPHMRISTAKKVCNALNTYVQQGQLHTIQEVLNSVSIDEYQPYEMTPTQIYNMPERIWAEYDIEEEDYWAIKRAADGYKNAVKNPYTLHDVFDD